MLTAHNGKGDAKSIKLATARHNAEKKNMPNANGGDRET